MRIVEVMLRSLIDIFFPRECHVCGEALTSQERYICSLCVDTLPRTHYIEREHSPMDMRFAGLVPYERATAWLIYSRGSTVAQLVHDFKYRSLPALAERLGEMMGRELLMAGFFGDADAVIPVPLHYLKRMRRGYNQAEALARGISKVTGMEVLGNLRAVRGHKTQTAKSPEERKKNLNGVFGVSHPEELDGRSVVIVDDVCTTGSTLLSAAETLHSVAPGCRFSLLALAATV